VPLDERAIVALSHSAVALDIYCWLAQRLHRIPPAKPQFVPWSGLHEQFGQEYARVRKFRATFLVLLRQVQVAYPEAKLEADSRGVVLHHSAPPVRKRLAIISGCAIGGAPAAPAPDSRRVIVQSGALHGYPRAIGGGILVQSGALSSSGHVQSGAQTSNSRIL
jgi:Plasmid encoded RepA protein